MPPSHRRATLLVVDARDRAIARLPAFDVPLPWVPEVSDVVSRARDQFGVELLILRVLEVRERPDRIDVTYAAELLGGSLPADARLERGEPLPGDDRRHDYARPGGALADLDWARRQLGVPVRAAVQVRTWNLSSIFRLETAKGRYWLKVVPRFFAHEGRVLGLLQGEPVPALVAAEDGRMLLRDVPGEDCWGADEALIRDMIATLVDMQWRLSSRIEALLAAGVPDRRWPSLVREIAEVVSRGRGALAGRARRRLDGFMDGLDERLAAVSECGVPDSFVHGDYHPGNWRGREGAPKRILDWGDCVVGHPLLDLPAFLDRVPGARRGVLRAHWLACWQRFLPEADVARAAALLEPVALAAKAATYQMFLDNIEAAERFHHEGDPGEFVRRTLAALAE